MRKQVEEEYWICIIGPTNSKNLKGGADFPMRNAVQDAFVRTAGHYADTCWSGWGTERSKVDVINYIWTLEENSIEYQKILEIITNS